MISSSSTMASTAGIVCCGLLTGEGQAPLILRPQILPDVEDSHSPALLMLAWTLCMTSLRVKQITSKSRSQDPLTSDCVVAGGSAILNELVEATTRLYKVQQTSTLLTNWHQVCRRCISCLTAYGWREVEDVGEVHNCASELHDILAICPNEDAERCGAVAEARRGTTALDPGSLPYQFKRCIPPRLPYYR